MQKLLFLLPQKEPFRFVHRIVKYNSGRSMKAAFDTKEIHRHCGNRLLIPPTCLLEGLAQTGIVFTQAETEPLSEEEMPLLGSVNAKIHAEVNFGAEVTYLVEKIRITGKQAILRCTLYQEQQIAMTATIGIAVMKKADFRRHYEG